MRSYIVYAQLLKTSSIDEEGKKFLHEERSLMLATVGPDGMPYIAGFYFVFEEDEGLIDIVTRPNIKTVRNIEKKPDVALLVDHIYRDDWKNQFVMVRGTATIIEDDPPVNNAVLRREEKYPYLAKERIAKPERERVVIRIKPSRVRSWIRARDTISPELRPPEHSSW